MWTKNHKRLLMTFTALKMFEYGKQFPSNLLYWFSTMRSHVLLVQEMVWRRYGAKSLLKQGWQDLWRKYVTPGLNGLKQQQQKNWQKCVPFVVDLGLTYSIQNQNIYKKSFGTDFHQAIYLSRPIADEGLYYLN